MFTFRYSHEGPWREAFKSSRYQRKPSILDRFASAERSRRHAMRLSWREMYRNVTWHRIRLRLLTRSEAIQPASLGYYPRVTSLGCSSLSKQVAAFPPTRQADKSSLSPPGNSPTIVLGNNAARAKSTSSRSQSLTTMMIVSPKGSKCNYRGPSRTLFVK